MLTLEQRNWNLVWEVSSIINRWVWLDRKLPWKGKRKKLTSSFKNIDTNVSLLTVRWQYVFTFRQRVVTSLRWKESFQELLQDRGEYCCWVLMQCTVNEEKFAFLFEILLDSIYLMSNAQSLPLPSSQKACMLSRHSWCLSTVRRTWLSIWLVKTT